MKIDFATESLDQLAAPALAAFAFDEHPSESGSVSHLPEATRGLLRELEESGELAGKLYEATLIHRPAGLAARALLVVGAGRESKFNTAVLRRLAGAAVRHLRARGVRNLAWLLGPKTSDPESVQALAEGAVLADFDADTYRSERNGDRRIDGFRLASGGPAPSDEMRTAAERGRVIAEAANFTRELVNEPSNRMTPEMLADRAQKMAAQFGLDCQVLDENEIQRLKMGALWGVGQGSEAPPRLIVLRYNLSQGNTAPGPESSPVIALVGKGITFDTGGISIKPAADMHEMKTDMAGGATMLGVMRAIAQLKPSARVMVVIPAAENMPSGKAYRPGDVLTSMSGKTIEVLNTDAEGRLALADAITYAKQQGAGVVIDAATLTGAVVVALGKGVTGVFGWDKGWVNRVRSSAEAVGERMWELPVDEDYRDLYKSSIADLANTGGRHGSAIVGAMFVGEFAGDTPWVHLDIAGTAWSNDEKPYLAKGPTGHPVRTLVHLLTHLS
ncbi:MAG TPA: leucyl aminopeptidase [Terriglobia bacterium]|nr:leucyl aminopeptidase [Terriglobia bacterium]